MPLTKAQCSNCGGAIEVDSSKEAAICPFCNTPYIVEKAINLYKTENHIVNNITYNNGDGLTPEQRIKNAFIFIWNNDNRSAGEMIDAYMCLRPDDYRVWLGKYYCKDKWDRLSLDSAAKTAPPDFSDRLHQQVALITNIFLKRDEIQKRKNEEENLKWFIKSKKPESVFVGMIGLGMIIIPAYILINGDGFSAFSIPLFATIIGGFIMFFSSFNRFLRKRKSANDLPKVSAYIKDEESKYLGMIKEKEANDKSFLDYVLQTFEFEKSRGEL